jgi:hypothetical protein
MQHIRFVSPLEGEEARVVMGVVHAAIVTNACPAEWGPLRAARLRTYLDGTDSPEMCQQRTRRAGWTRSTPACYSFRFTTFSIADGRQVHGDDAKGLVS